MANSASEIDHRVSSLLIRIAASDSAAFQELYELTVSNVLGLCVNIMRSRNDAELVTEEVFVSIWRKRVNYDPSLGTPLSWLCAVTRDRAIKRLRRSPAFEAESDDLSVELENDRTEPAKPSVLAQQLTACLQQINPQAARAIRAGFLEGASYDTLAKREGLELDEVKRLVQINLLHLGELLTSNSKVIPVPLSSRRATSPPRITRTAVSSINTM